MLKKISLIILICFITSLLFSGERSSEWSKVRKQHIKIEPICQLCGTAKSLQVHHICPFHIFPKLELEQTNLITVCTSRYWGFNCHFDVAHAGNFKYYNPWIREDIQHIQQLVNSLDSKVSLDSEKSIRAYLKYINLRAKKLYGLITPLIEDPTMKDDNGEYTEEFYTALDNIKKEIDTN